MALSLWYSEQALKQINQYLQEISDDMIAVAAGEELRREMLRLAAAPPPSELGPAGGPWESRHLHRFLLDVAGRRQAVVTYRVSEETQQFQILLFRQSPTLH